MPNIEKGTVPPRRVRNEARRPREYLTPNEVDRIIKAARERGRYGHRDATMIVLAYTHGFRVSELTTLQWDQVELDQGLLHVRRRKHGTPSVHPLRGVELGALRIKIAVGTRVTPRPYRDHNLDGSFGWATVEGERERERPVWGQADVG